MNFAKLTLIAVASLFVFSKCPKDTAEPSATLFGTGWNSSEDFATNVPVAINYGNYQGSNGSLPSSVDLTPYFPPIRNQGQIGTCVAWSVGYNYKTYLDGVAKKLSSSQLAQSAYEYSPTDLFFSISPNLRSCNNGTNFNDALNVLVNRGVNTLANVPYDEVCRSASPGSASGAASNKIKNFRRIQGSVAEIKQYLAQGIPVALGAMVNAQFQALHGSGVLNDLNYGGGAAGHAMVIAGYDDSRNAFRIINSWGNTWGDNGYLWVNYDFLVNKFCVQGGQKSLFVAFNDNTTTVTPPPATSAPDMTSLVSADYTLYPNIAPFINARRALFDVKNVGNQTIQSSTNWNIYYLWVDAFNANNYGVIFRGEFTNSIPQNTYQNINANYSKINFNLAPGASLAQTIFNTSYINWDYYMPALYGNYYLVMFIDKGNSTETNQTNNVFYVTQSPKLFTNGYSLRSNTERPETKYNFENMLGFRHALSAMDLNNENFLRPYRSLSNAEFANAYTSEEVISFLQYKIKHGGL